jgi:hypothetical protein
MEDVYIQNKAKPLGSETWKNKERKNSDGQHKNITA